MVQGWRPQLEASSLGDSKIDVCTAPQPLAMHDDKIQEKVMHFLVKLDLVLKGGTLTFFFMSLYECMSESILNIIPDRKFKLSWQPNDIEDFTHSEELMK